MLKKAMVLIMALITVMRLGATTFVITANNGNLHLPLAVYISAGIVIVLGISLICKRILSAVRSRELELFFSVTALSVVFNLFYMKLSSRVDLVLSDFMVIGTVMDILVSVVLVFMAEKERRYFQTPVYTDR